MAYDFLGLVNDVNSELNEVQLNSTNFANADGYYKDAKKAVNSALNIINTFEFEWPFNHVTNTEDLVVDQSRYTAPIDCKTISYDTFRIQGDDSLNVETTRLEILDYEEYLSKYVGVEYVNNNQSDKPVYVFRTRDNNFGIYPPADAAYKLDYEYYSVPTDLVNYDDVPTIPEIFRYVINLGSMHYAYKFRGDLEASQISWNDFKEALGRMRSIYLNRHEYVRSSKIVKRGQ